MDSGRRKRSSSRDSSRSGESSSSSSRNGSGSSSRRRRSSNEGSSRRTSRANSEDEAASGKNKLLLALTVVGIIALGVAFYVVFDAGENPQGAPGAPVATATPMPTLTDSSMPPEPPKDLGLTMEQYLDKLDSFGDHFQQQADFSKFAVHARVDWRCKVYSNDTDSPVKSVKLISAGPDGEKYHVNAFFYKPEAALINRLRLLQRGDVVRLTGAINEDDIHVVDAVDLVLTN